jgi:hypothetical protein
VYTVMVNYFKPYKSGTLLCDIISNFIMIRFDKSIIYDGLVFDVNTTGSTPEEKVSRHVTLVGTTILFSLNYRKFNCSYCHMVNYFKPYKSGTLLCDIISNFIMIRFDKSIIYDGLVFDNKKYKYECIVLDPEKQNQEIKYT